MIICNKHIVLNILPVWDFLGATFIVKFEAYRTFRLVGSPDIFVIQSYNTERKGVSPDILIYIFNNLLRFQDYVPHNIYLLFFYEDFRANAPLFVI